MGLELIMPAFAKPAGPVIVPVTRGVATRVGSLTNFGANVRQPTSLVSHEGTLYVYDNSGRVLFTVNAETEQATRVGEPFRGIQGMASLNGTLYGVSEREAFLFTINPTTGASAFVTTTNLLPNRDMRGMTAHNGQLYSVDAGSNLYTINHVTGVGTKVGSLTNFGITGTTPSPASLASHDGNLYMIDAVNYFLYTLDPSTGKATRVGNTPNYGLPDRSFPFFGGLTSHNGALTAAATSPVIGLYTFS